MVKFRNPTLGKRLKNFFGTSRRKARENFKGENSKRFDLTLFRKETIKIVFDSLHGIDNEKARDENYIMKFCIAQIPHRYGFHPLDSVKLSEALEILAYCLYDGKIDQKSEFEKGLYDDIVDELRIQSFKFGFLLWQKIILP